MSCPACEKNRSMGRRFCDQCGEALTPVPAPAPTQSQWKAGMEPPAPTPAPVETGKKKNTATIVILCVIAAVILAAVVLFATGVLMIGGSDTDRGSTGGGDDPAVAEETAAPAQEDDGPVAIHEDDYCSIRYRGMEEKSDCYYILLTIENKLDQVLTFELDADGFDGYRTTTFRDMSFEEVEGEDTQNVRFEIEKYTLDHYGIESFQTVHFTIEATDDDYDTVMETEAWIYAETGAPADDFAVPARMTWENEQTVIDTDSVRVVMGKPRMENDQMLLPVYFENDNSDYVELNLRDCTLNGEMFYEYDDILMPANSKGYAILYYSDFDLEDVSVTFDTATEFGAHADITEWENYDTLFEEDILYSWG